MEKLYTVEEILSLGTTAWQKAVANVISQARAEWQEEIDEAKSHPEDGRCFECGATGSIHKHHVIPRSLGGKNTVPLCESCHGKVHGKNMVDHSRLSKLGLDRARARGKVLGRPKGTGWSPQRLVARHPDITEALLLGTSIRKTVILTKKSHGTVEKVKKALATL